MSADPTAKGIGPVPDDSEPRRISVVAPPSAAEEDRETLMAFQRAGLLGEMTDALLESLLDRVDPINAADVRAVDLLVLYYRDGDRAVADRRHRADRFVLIEEAVPLVAAQVIDQLADLFPELPSLALVRIGGPDGPLVLQTGEQTIAIDDDGELEEGEVDLSDFEETDTVSVQALIGALNQMLERFGVLERLILLRGDGRGREAYGATGAAEAARLCREGQIEDLDDEVLFDLAGW